MYTWHKTPNWVMQIVILFSCRIPNEKRIDKYSQCSHFSHPRTEKSDSTKEVFRKIVNRGLFHIVVFPKHSNNCNMKIMNEVIKSLWGVILPEWLDKESVMCWRIQRNWKSKNFRSFQDCMILILAATIILAKFTITIAEHYQLCDTR